MHNTNRPLTTWFGKELFMEEEINEFKKLKKEISQLKRFLFWLLVLFLMQLTCICLLLDIVGNINRFAKATNTRLQAEEQLSREQHHRLKELIQEVNGCCQSEIEAPPPPAPPTSPSLPRNFLLEILGRKFNSGRLRSLVKCPRSASFC